MDQAKPVLILLLATLVATTLSFGFAEDDGAPMVCNMDRASAWNSQHHVAANDFTVAAIDTLHATKQALDSAGVPFFVASGTLLGWYRNCMPIPWDNDVDVGVWISDWKPEIYESMKNAGFTHDFTVGSRAAGLTEVFMKAGVRQDIHFYYPDTDNDQVFIQLWEHDISYRESWTSFALQPAEVFGVMVNVPSNVERYLKEGYGDYMTKRTKSIGKSEWDSISSPPNSGPGSLPMDIAGRRYLVETTNPGCVNASYTDGWSKDPAYGARSAHCRFSVADRSKEEKDEAKCKAKGCCKFYADYNGKRCSAAPPNKYYDGDKGPKIPCNDQCKSFDANDDFISKARAATVAMAKGEPFCAKAFGSDDVETSKGACTAKGCCSWTMGSYKGPDFTIGKWGSSLGFCEYSCDYAGVLQGCMPTCKAPTMAPNPPTSTSPSELKDWFSKPCTSKYMSPSELQAWFSVYNYAFDCVKSSYIDERDHPTDSWVKESGVKSQEACASRCSSTCRCMTYQWTTNHGPSCLLFKAKIKPIVTVYAAGIVVCSKRVAVNGTTIGTTAKSFDTTTLFRNKLETTSLFGTGPTPKPSNGAASGLRIKGERATIELGADISLSREDKGILNVLADHVQMKYLHAHDITIDKYRLKDYIRSTVKDLLKELKVI